MLNSYLKWWFKETMNYNIKNRGMWSDEAIRATAEFIFNTIKYQLVKYIWVFNLIYKFHLSNIEKTVIENISWFDALLLKLEYNALTFEWKIASDYWVTSNILKYFESENDKQVIRSNFDEFEVDIFSKLSKVIERNNQ
jgi:hypothetical protein